MNAARARLGLMALLMPVLVNAQSPPVKRSDELKPFANVTRASRVADAMTRHPDIVLIEGDPLANIADMRRVKRVMFNGRWIFPVTGGRCDPKSHALMDSPEC